MSMRKFQQNKLWRDKMVAHVEQMGSVVHCHRLDDAAYDQQLRLKLLEEADEVARATNQKELIAELGDVLEAIDALCVLHGLAKEDVLAVPARQMDPSKWQLAKSFYLVSARGRHWQE